MNSFQRARSDQKPGSAQADFLVDTTTYQGVSRDFEVVEVLAAKPLRHDQPLRDQLTKDEAIRCAMESLFQVHLRLEIVMAGWVDQSVLEFHSSREGDIRYLPTMLAMLDAYRPDQDGDICFYLADLDYNEVVGTIVSFQSELVDSKVYRRIRRAMREDEAAPDTGA